MKLPVIQNAFENVKKFSQEKLVEKYPNGVPEAIQKRYLQLYLIYLLHGIHKSVHSFQLTCLYMP